MKMIRPHYRTRRGFTMLETLVASIMTTIVVAAGSTMLMAVSYATIDTSQENSVSQQGHAAVERLTALLRSARLPGYRTADHLLVWVKDDNRNDTVELSELALVSYDSAGKRVLVTKPFASGATVAEIAASNRTFTFTELGTAAAAAAVRGAPAPESIVYARNVEGAEFTLNSADADASAVTVAMKIKEKDTAKKFVGNASMRAPANYLLAADRNSDDGNIAARKRRTELPTWKVPS